MRAINTRAYIEMFLKIRNKHADIIPFQFNEPQARLYDALAAQWKAGKPMRAIVLKARQEGISTLTEAMIFKRTATAQNRKAVIVAHTEQSTKSLFEMSKLFYDNLPEELKPETRSSNAYELAFDVKDAEGLKSNIVCYTAGGRGIGRGDTIHSLHCSEYAFWPEGKKDIFGGLIQAVPSDPDTLVVIESTANGFDDFKDRWDKAVAGESDFAPVFFAWFDLSGYQRDVPDGFTLQSFGRYGNEIQVKNTFRLSDRQMSWRRWCIDNNCSGDLNLFHQEYPATPEEAFIATGDNVFNNDIVIQQLARIRNLVPESVGYFSYNKQYLTPDHSVFSNIEWVEDRSGCITIYEKPQVKTRDEQGQEILPMKCPYVLGGDTAGHGEDYFAGVMLNNITKDVAAVFHKQTYNDDLFADQAYCLGKYYHEALIGIETNFSITAMRELEKARYPRLYLRDRFDSLTNNYVKALGFETTAKSRPVILDNLVKIVRDTPEVIKDARILREMLTFVRNPLTGKREALEGKHDDLVMASAIAYFICEQMPAVWQESQEKPKKDFIARNFTPKETTEGGIIEW